MLPCHPHRVSPTERNGGSLRAGLRDARSHVVGGGVQPPLFGQLFGGTSVHSPGATGAAWLPLGSIARVSFR